MPAAPTPCTKHGTHVTAGLLTARPNQPLLSLCSGGSHGFVIGHVCPEAQEGGPIALVQVRRLIS